MSSIICLKQFIGSIHFECPPLQIFNKKIIYAIRKQMEQSLEKMAYTIGLPLNCNRPVNLTHGLWREKTAVYSLQIGGFPYHKHNRARTFVHSLLNFHSLIARISLCATFNVKIHPLCRYILCDNSVVFRSKISKFWLF